MSSYVPRALRALLLAAFAVTLLFIQSRAADAQSGVTSAVTPSGNSLVVSFGYPNASLAILHYVLTTNGVVAGQQNVTMSGSNGSFTYSVPTTAGATETMTYTFTYQVNGIQSGAPSSGSYSYPSSGSSQLVATPVFSVPSGTYSSTQTVAVSDSTSGATILCSINGGAQSTCPSSITVSSSESISAVATASGMTNSATATATYTISAQGGASHSVVPSGNTLAVSFSYPNATLAILHYVLTTNGSTAGQQNVTMSGSNGSFTYSVPTTAGATETMTYTFTYQVNGIQSSDPTSGSYSYPTSGSAQVATPVFSLAAGTYNGTQTVTVSDSTSGATILCSINGGAQSTCPNPITVSSSESISAVATESGMTNSAAATASYTINTQVATPTFSVPAGTYSSTQSVTVSDSTSGATILCSINGGAQSTCPNPITVSSSESISAVATESGMTNSAAATASYTISPQVATPTFSVPSGTYSSTQTVTVSDSTSGATILCSINGGAQSTCPNPITVSSSESISAVATDSGMTNSATATASYTISSNGSFTRGVQPIGASSYEIWFTPTWTVPSGATMEVVYQIISPSGVAGTQYGLSLTAPVAPSSTWTLSGISAPPGSNIQYYFNYYSPSAGGPVLAPTTAPGTPYTYLVCANQALSGCPTPISAPVANPSAGVYAPNTVPFPVSLSSSTPGTTIYYTTDGTYPTTTSKVYSGPIEVTTSESINAIALLTSTGQQSSDLVAAYAIETPCTQGSTGACEVATPYFIGNQPNSSSSPYQTQIGVNMLTATPGALIYYTITPGTTGTTPDINSVVPQPGLANLVNGSASPTTTVFVPSTIWLNNAGGTNSTWTIEAIATMKGQTSGILKGTFTVNASATTSTAWNGNVTVNVVNNSGNQLSWFIYGRESLADPNGDGGSYCGNYVVVVPPPAGSPAGTLATLQEVAPGVPPPYNSGEAPALTVGAGTSDPNVYFNWAYPAGTTSFVSPPVCSGRIYFSTGSKPLLNAVNIIENPGPGAPTNDYGWVNPSLNDQNDPNQGVAFDYGEFDTAPLRQCTLAAADCMQAPGIWADTTRVDLFSLPIQVEVTGEDGFDAVTGETLTETSAQLRALFLVNVPPAFQELEQPLSILNPSNDPSFNTPGATNSTYLDPYIQQVWNQLAATPVTLNLAGYAPLTCQQAGGVVTCNPGNIQIVQPNTLDVLPCNSSIGADPGEQGAVEAQFCAALNRHVANQPFSNWWNPLDFYSAAPTNYYAQFFHQHAWDGLSYGFAYDDVGGLSSTIFTYSPTTVTYTIGK